MMQNVAAYVDPHVVFQGDNKLSTYSGVVNDKYISVYSVWYRFTFFNLRIPRASDSEKSWSLSAPTIDIEVTDNYGNSGKIAITLTTRNNGPYLEVNGV